jgi:hypothetical protein
MKVFISCPMKGLSREEITQKRASITKKLEERFENITVIDSYFSEFDLMKSSLNVSVYCLGRSIIKLSEADVVVFAEGWENARGCRIEHTIAQDYGMDIILL